MKFKGTKDSDVIHGVNGDDDLIYGLNGSDTLYGYAGNDVIYGDQGGDRLYGGEGNDEIYGGSEGDYLFGENGNDILFGEDGNDFIFGNNGNNTLVGGAGNDELWGGEGASIYSPGSGDETDLQYATEPSRCAAKKKTTSPLRIAYRIDAIGYGTRPSSIIPTASSPKRRVAERMSKSNASGLVQTKVQSMPSIGWLKIY